MDVKTNDGKIFSVVHFFLRARHIIYIRARRGRGDFAVFGIKGVKFEKN